MTTGVAVIAEQAKLTVRLAKSESALSFNQHSTADVIAAATASSCVTVCSSTTTI